MPSFHPFRGYYASVFEAYAAVTNGTLDRDHPHTLQRTEGPRKRKWIKRLPEFVKKSERNDDLSRCGL